MGNDLDNSKVEEEVRWKPTCNRFVAFFDVMGFKDYVMRNKHEDVLKRITDIKNAKQLIIDGTTPGLFMDTKLKSFQFSDSFFIFSESDSPQDAFNLLHQSKVLMSFCNKQQIPLKGAVSYGEITVDFDNSIFVGQPIIDAFLLHEELEMYGAILDFNAEKKIMEITSDDVYNMPIKNEIIQYRVPTKNGNINHQCIDWTQILIYMPNTEGGSSPMLNLIDAYYIENFYSSVSGKPRKYVDNTLDFVNSLIKKYREEIPGIGEIKTIINLKP